MLRTLVFFSIFAASTAFAQLDSNSVTVTSSKNATTTIDQANYTISINTNATTTLDQVVASLQALGITAANLSNISNTTSYLGNNTVQARLNWGFSWPTPIAKAKDTVTQLLATQAAIKQNQPDWSFSFSSYSTYSGQNQAPPPCPSADLLADAKAQAQKLADTAGLALGQVLALSGSTTSSCSITVKFALLRY